MATAKKIESNIVGLRYSWADDLDTEPAGPWYPLEPNTMTEFGANVSTVTRDFISTDRQRHKGTVTDREAGGKLNHDLVQVKLQDLLQGFFFAALRKKVEKTAIVTVDDDPDDYVAASGLDDYAAGDLVLASGFAAAANNGLKRVTFASATNLTVAESLAAEVVATDVKLVQVGFQFASGDVSVDVTGDLPKLVTIAKDCEEFGLVPGEFIWIGGDSADTRFATTADAGLARVRSVDTNEIVLDKTQATFTIDAGAAKTIQIFFPRVLKNEVGPDILTKILWLERSLGAPDTTAPSDIQYEYVKNVFCDEMTITVPERDKVMMDLSFMGLDVQLNDADTGELTGDRPAAVAEDAFNTSSNVPRINMSAVTSTDSAPTPLFTYVTELSINIKNNVSRNTAVGVVGAFDASIGNFEVSGSMTAYFADVAAVQAVHDYTTISLDAHFFKSNTGITIDMPAVCLGDGRINVEKDNPVKLPLTNDAVSGAIVDEALDHTVMLMFWDYLPAVAMP